MELHNTLSDTHESMDLAEGTFVYSWSKGLRWALFLPGAVVCSWLAYIAYKLIIIISNWFYAYVQPTDWWVELVASAILGGVFVYVGSLVAPKQQFGISIILLIIAAMISGVSVLGLIYYADSWLGLLRGLSYVGAVLLSAGLVVFHIKEELET